ncbi:MAG: cellulase family glycosylhydrolase [Chloroflexi bacterium]|nr:cellulase family glycosylhydrolase [Chloroflexota bacterium]
MLRQAARLVATLALLAMVALPRSDGSAQEEEFALPNGRFYTQTVGGGRGFGIVDNAEAPFWSEFQRLGGVQGVGYPISRRFVWNGFVSQAMQRVVFQWRPDLGQVAFVNVFDLMSQQGLDDWLDQRQVPRPLPSSFDAGKDFGQVIQDRLALLDSNPAIRQQYNSVADPVAANGLPTSRVTDMGNHFSMRFQRVVMQQWKENVPWAAAGQVTVALGGTISAEAGLLPDKSALSPEAAPGLPPIVVIPSPTPTRVPRLVPLIYGFQVDPSESYSRALQLTTGAGFGWIKYQTRWEEFEPRAGAHNWGFLDGVVSGAEAAKVKVLLSVVTAPGWARPGQDLAVHGPPTDPLTYARFVGALAARYKGRVAAYEVWNEQNLAREWGGTGRQSAAAYVALLKPAYQAIKAADPAAIVVTGALTPAGNVNIPELGGLLARDDAEFLREMYQAGMKGSFDAVGVHPSGFNNDPALDPRDPAVLSRAGGFHAHRSFYFRNFEFYWDVMVENGDADKKLWFTEFGWASGCGAGVEWAYAQENTEQLQADYLARAYQIGKERGEIGAMFLWNLNFRTADQAKCAFAVLNPDGTPRPAYTALARLPK